MAADAGDERSYFRSIETRFIELRGSPFLLSPSDWRVAKRWYEAGIPLETVIGALDELFERRAERGAAGPVQGLRYCAAAVEEAWAERRELAAGEGAPEDGYALPVGDRLDRLARALPEGLGERQRWQQRLRELTGATAAVEDRLAELDRQLLDEAAAGLTENESAALEGEVDATLDAMSGQLDDEDRAAHRERLRRDALRRRLDLPLLSLFAPEARET